jgi:hypothetical protein
VASGRAPRDLASGRVAREVASGWLPPGVAVGRRTDRREAGRVVAVDLIVDLVGVLIVEQIQQIFAFGTGPQRRPAGLDPLAERGEQFPPPVRRRLGKRLLNGAQIVVNATIVRFERPRRPRIRKAPDGSPLDPQSQ